MDSRIGDDLYLAFLEQQIEEVRNSIGILREAIIQMVAERVETKQQSEALLSLLNEMICLKAIRKDLFDSLGSNNAVSLHAFPFLFFQRWLRKFGQLDKWRPCFTISVAGPNTGARA